MLLLWIVRNFKLMNELITTNQAAEYLGVTPKTLRRWESEGKIKAIRTLGGHRRFYKSDLDQLLNQ